MRTIDEIRRKLLSGEFEFSRHAFIRAVERNISDLESDFIKIITLYEPDDASWINFRNRR